MRGDRIKADELAAQTALSGELNENNAKKIEERVSGPWVFGLYQNNRAVRFFVLSDKKASTLMPIILEQVKEGSVTVSDGGAAYRRIPDFGYTHYTVCQKRNYVDPESGFHKQAIERAWCDAKSYIKRARGAGPLIQAHLDELSWRKASAEKNVVLFAPFWNRAYTSFEIDSQQH